jgi:glycerol-1-phosphate dehydrogenase [NAD(P)+]
MDINQLLTERGIELKYIDSPTYTRKIIPEQNIITNDDEFTKSLLIKAGFTKFHPVSVASVEVAEKLAKQIGPGEIVGVGGGKAIDMAKRVSVLLNRPFVAFPTAPSHDGLVSKNCSLYNGHKRVSLPAKYPRKLIIPLHLWKHSGNLRKAGICDILSNIIALQDLSLASAKGVSYEPIYKEMSQKAIDKVLNLKDDKDLAEALILSGIAMENGSQYCSGSEHETERLLESYLNGKYLHGQLAGTGTLISAKVYLTFDSSEIFDQLVSLMKRLDLLDFALHPLQDPKFNPSSLKGLTKVRPERYTLWNEIDSEKLDWNKIIKEILKTHNF